MSIYINFEEYLNNLENQARNLFNLAKEMECLKTKIDEKNEAGLFLYNTQRAAEIKYGIYKGKLDSLIEIIKIESRYFDDLKMYYSFNIYESFPEFYKSLSLYEKKYFDGFLGFKIKNINGYLNEISLKEFINSLTDKNLSFELSILLRNTNWLFMTLIYFISELNKLKPLKQTITYKWNTKYKAILEPFYKNLEPFFKKELTLKDFKICFSGKPIQDIKNPIKINLTRLSGIDLIYLIEVLMDKNYIDRESKTDWIRFAAIFKDFEGNPLNTESLKAQKSTRETDYSISSIQKVDNIVP
jgi:hypothetical protein